MKTIFLFITTLFFYLPAFAQLDSINVLFLGNSYTGVNNLPQMVHDFAQTGGVEISFDSNTPGGYTLKQHSANATTIQQIEKGDWDFVVLQEQSQLPSFPDFQVQADVYPYATVIDNLINQHNPCAETVFYMTWGRKNGDQGNCPNWPPVCTYEGMDSLLSLRYTTMANTNNAILSPIGALWHYLRDNHPNIELYSADESHPSLVGSYAATCSFYTVLTRKDPTLVFNDLGIPPGDAQIIRDAAKTVIYDNLLKWNVGDFDPLADFTVDTSVHLLATFLNTSMNTSEYEWDFGDGNTSTDKNPTHGYAHHAIKMYDVVLVASICGNLPDTLTKSITITGEVSVSENSEDYKIWVFPNPVKGEINFNFNSNQQRTLIIYDVKGSNVLSVTESATVFKFDVSSFDEGLYYYKISSEGNVVTGNFIKQ
jgi:PKD repeat protein